LHFGTSACGRITIIGINERGKRTLTPGGPNAPLAWDPNGQAIAYNTSSERTGPTIRIVIVRSEDSMQIAKINTRGTVGVGTIAWRPLKH
jgi:hypothetical protein